MSIEKVKVQTTGSSYSLPYRFSSNKLTYDCGQTLQVSAEFGGGSWTIGRQAYGKEANEGYSSVTCYSGFSDSNRFGLGCGAFLYVKPTGSSSYYLIDEDFYYITWGRNTQSETSTDDTTWTLATNETVSFTFTIPDYAYNGQPLYLAICDCVIDTASYSTIDYYLMSDPRSPTNFKSSYSGNYFSLTSIGTCSRANTMSTVSVNYPSFTCSSKAIVSIPTVKNAYKMELQKSTDNGTNWTKIYETSTSTSMTDNATWSIKDLANNTNVDAIFSCPPPIPDQSINVSDATVPTKYRAIYTGTSDNTVTGSSNLEILDLSLPTGSIPDIESYSGRTAETFSITNTTITDLSRISFKEMFARTSLPNTIQTCTNGVLQYSVQALDKNNSLETNLGNYFILPNADYEYRIYPILDGSTDYMSTDNSAYQHFNYTKSTTKLKMTRPIEMGSVQPTKIKLLLNPSIDKLPSGATLTFYVANNGNDDNIAWEELPSSCLGTTSSPDCDIYYFTNESKTADTWKVMVKVVADRGTASTEVTLKSIIVVINGGEVDNRPSGYKYLTNVVLDTAATTVDLEIPPGYRKYKIIGNIINAHSGGNPRIRLNNITSGYNCYYVYMSDSTTNSGSYNYIMCDTTTYIGDSPQFELDLFCYNSKWYGTMTAIGSKGASNSHGVLSLTSDLNTINIINNMAQYPMQPGTEFTVLGVD